MGEQFGLVIQLAARHRAMDAIKISGNVQMIQDSGCERRPF
jgi:hypothetical protein